MLFTCTQIDSSTTQCISEASSSPAFINGFSYGEVLQISLLGMIFLLLFFEMFYKTFFGVKIKVPVARQVETRTANGEKIIQYD